MKTFGRRLLVIMALLTVLILVFPVAFSDGGITARSKKQKSSPTPAVTVTPSPTITDSVSGTEAQTPSPVPTGPITDAQSVADYIFANGCLPDNFITKAEAQALGWDSSRNYVGDVAPGKSLGGSRYGNYEGLVPSAPGRTWKECDINYSGRKRGADRIVYSNDGLVYYTGDHYQTFIQMFPSGTVTPEPSPSRKP